MNRGREKWPIGAADSPNAPISRSASTALAHPSAQLAKALQSRHVPARAILIGTLFGSGSALLGMVGLTVIVSPRETLAESAQVDAHGTIHVPAFTLPESSLLDETARAALNRAREEGPAMAVTFKACPSMEGADRAARVAIQQCQWTAFYKTRWYQRFRERYPVEVTPQRIGGVDTEVFTPKEGVAPENKDRVLINLHGGHFLSGFRTTSHQESIPIASVGKLEVISIDYRHAPDDTFPAASQDVAAVYRELLKTYEPHHIGVYGSSAGGLLTAESIAWFLKEGLPLPGAVGLFASGASYYQDGDSGHLASARDGLVLTPPPEHPYFKGIDARDPLAFPIYSLQVLAQFPPSLLISSTRDLALSSVVHTHAQLVKLGVEAELHVWEGLTHTFYLDIPELPESREAYEAITRFFDQHLARSANLDGASLR